LISGWQRSHDVTRRPQWKGVCMRRPAAIVAVKNYGEANHAIALLLICQSRSCDHPDAAPDGWG